MLHRLQVHVLLCTWVKQSESESEAQILDATLQTKKLLKSLIHKHNPLQLHDVKRSCPRM